uniref:Uncharacterized protein n=1 Tax=Euplotes harpa TaxID=151035 RepID=A0A7S3JK81_9SPIT|mmetsp:Transcript_4943/g.5824  ORF Transcript_4943/g.5824 Transcript_4943/m.5824 type:complete len:298 (+) Transcript_4943:27-920(+)
MFRPANLMRTKGMIKNFKRCFSSGSGPDLGSMARTANLALLGLGTAGLTYMMYRARANAQVHAPESQVFAPGRVTGTTYAAPKINHMSPVIQSRIQSAMAYFGGGLALTGLSVSLFRFSSLAYMNPWIMLIPTLGALFGTMYFNYHTQSTAKHLCWGAFCGLEGLALAPLINMAGMPIVFNALAATGTMMGLLGAYAYNSPNADFLNWRGYLSMGLCGLIGVSLMNVFWPTSLGMTLSLYGGLLLFGGFVLYDTQKLKHNALQRSQWDPINESISIYLDAIIIFQKFLIIFMNNKKK